MRSCPETESEMMNTLNNYGMVKMVTDWVGSDEDECSRYICVIYTKFGTSHAFGYDKLTAISNLYQKVYFTMNDEVDEI